MNAKAIYTICALFVVFCGIAAAEEEIQIRKLLQTAPFLRIPVYGQPNWGRVAFRLIQNAAQSLSFGPTGAYIGPFVNSAFQSLDGLLQASSDTFLPG